MIPMNQAPAKYGYPEPFNPLGQGALVAAAQGYTFDATASPQVDASARNGKIGLRAYTADLLSPLVWFTASPQQKAAFSQRDEQAAGEIANPLGLK